MGDGLPDLYITASPGLCEVCVVDARVRRLAQNLLAVQMDFLTASLDCLTRKV